MPPPMSLESEETTPERIAAMSGQAKRAESGTRSNRDSFAPDEPVPPADALLGALPLAGAATSTGVFPFTAEAAHSPLFIFPLFLAV